VEHAEAHAVGCVVHLGVEVVDIQKDLSHFSIIEFKIKNEDYENIVTIVLIADSEPIT
jgi:hypothetical protein